MDASRYYRIGEMARRTGVSVETLRYYEKRGLLDAPQRTAGGFRLYSDAALQQVKFIKQAQALGLTLGDIQQLSAGRLRAQRASSCRRVRDLLTRRIGEIDARMTELRELRRTLHEHLAACDRALASAVDPECPTIDALNRPEGRRRRQGAR